MDLNMLEGKNWGKFELMRVIMSIQVNIWILNSTLIQAISHYHIHLTTKRLSSEFIFIDDNSQINNC